jgi:hypothetical protein
METIVELVGKLIEDVCVVSKPSEQNQSLAYAAPIQDLKLDARFDRDETDFMSRSIEPADIVHRAFLCRRTKSIHTRLVQRGTPLIH